VLIEERLLASRDSTLIKNFNDKFNDKSQETSVVYIERLEKSLLGFVAPPIVLTSAVR
jgi:hypothetical protein